MGRDTDRSLTPWMILGAAAAVLAVEVAVAPDLRALVRVTARTSLAWFLLAFVARPLTALRVPGGKGLLRHRRQLGLAFAISHGGHLLAIAALARHEGSVFWDKVAITTLAGGGFGYLILAGMVATSWDGAQTWLGRRRWRALHLTGMWTFWLIFTSSYAPSLHRHPIAAVATVALVGAATLRAWAATRGASARSARAARVS